MNVPINILHGIYTIPEKGNRLIISLHISGNIAIGIKAPEKKFVKISLPFNTP